MPSESMLLVRPEHLNHHGNLFGGRLLEWLDEQSYIAAIARMDPAANLVTVGIDNVEFRHQVRLGAVLRFRSRPVHVGRTSITISTAVAVMPEEQTIFQASVTFVALGGDGRPMPVAPLLLKPYKPGTAEERKLWREVEQKRRRLKRKA